MLILAREVRTPSTMQEEYNVVRPRRFGSLGEAFPLLSLEGTLIVDFPMKYVLAAMGCATAITLLFFFADHGVLGMAAKYAEDEPKLVTFMRDMGYPKAGEWCGEFAASVIKRAGGTPPADAAIASNWRRYGTPDAMPHVGDVAVAGRGVPTGSIGSHVGFVTGVDVKSGTFTLESGNSSNIYTTRKISCFSFHTPPATVLSALIGNGVPSETAIGNILTGLPLSSIGAYPFLPAKASADSDDCSPHGLDGDNSDWDNDDEIQIDDSLQQVQAPANNLDGERVCVLHSPSSEMPRFCPFGRVIRESTVFRRCTMTTKGQQCLAWHVRASMFDR